MRNFWFYCLQWKLDWLRIPKTCICMWYFLRFHLICVLNYRLDLFHQSLRRQFHLCIKLLDENITNSVPCICILIGWNWQKCDLLWLFSEFSDGDSEQYIEFITLLRCPDKSIMPRIAEISVWLIVVENLPNPDSKMAMCCLALTFL